MRALPIFASLFVVGTSGCIGHSGRAVADDVRSIGAVVEVAIPVVLLAAELAPRTTTTSELAPPFDIAAASASLESIEYLDCGPGSLAELTVMFAPTGHVQLVTINTGNLGSDVAECVAARFARAEAPPFSGPPRALRCRIRLAQ